MDLIERLKEQITVQDLNHMVRAEYTEYKKRQDKEPYYTEIHPVYFYITTNISDINYIKQIMRAKMVTPAVLLEACKKYPEVFAWWMLGIRLRPYQILAINEMMKKRDVALAWSRRTGKSTIVKLYVLWTATFNLLPGKMTGTTWNIILQDQDIANSLYIEPLHEIMEKGDKVTNKTFKGVLGENYFTNLLVTRRDKTGKVRANQISLKTSTGICRISTMPPTNRAIGREGNIIGDEVSKWKKNPKLKDEFKYFDQLIAIKKDNPKTRAIFLSTPEGDQDLFAKEIFDPNNEREIQMFHKMWCPYWVWTDKQWLNEIEKTKKIALENKRISLFMQEYEAKFITISDAYFDNDEHITRNITPDLRWRRITERNVPCALGIDWGGSAKARTVLSVYAQDDKKLAVPIYLKRYEVGEDLEKFDRDIILLRRNYNIRTVVVDNKGGRWMIPKLEKIFGKGRVIQFNFTTDKIAGYELFREALVKNLITIPNDTILLTEMRNFTQQLKPNSSNGTDDVVDAVMMSVQPFLQIEERTTKIWTY